jgi:hypothetical protein
MVRFLLCRVYPWPQKTQNAAKRIIQWSRQEKTEAWTKAENSLDREKENSEQYLIARIRNSD